MDLCFCLLSQKSHHLEDNRLGGFLPAYSSREDKIPIYLDRISSVDAHL